jgi:Helix-turn-helix domain
MSQKMQVLNHIKSKGSITPMEAFSRYQITCLAERIRDLKDSGHLIATEMVKRNGKRFAKYRLVA